VWIAGTKGNPGRFSSHWILWFDAPRRAPLYLSKSDLTQYRFAAAPTKQGEQP
jgi:hypothetical protein